MNLGPLGHLLQVGRPLLLGRMGILGHESERGGPCPGHPAPSAWHQQAKSQEFTHSPFLATEWAGSHGGQVQPIHKWGPGAGQNIRSHARVLERERGRKELDSQAAEEGKDCGMPGMEWEEAAVPPAFCTGTNGEPKDGGHAGPNTEKKAAVWPTLGILGWDEGSCGASLLLSSRAQGHKVQWHP